MDKWYGYIFGDNGAFTENSYIVDNYENVDAIVLTNVVNAHTGWFNYVCNVWDLNNLSSTSYCKRLAE